jgi:hypothetical protein
MNAEVASENGKSAKAAPSEPPFVLLYRTNGANTLVLYEMDNKATAAAIRAHEIAGEVERGWDRHDEVSITADEPALDAFMRTPRAASLFKKPMVTLTRIE